MNVERTMEFILQMQARSEVRGDRFDKRLDATSKLVQTGMKLLVKIEKDFDRRMTESKKDFNHRLNELIEAQKKTDEAQKKTGQKLDRLIDFWTRRRSNGHPH